MGSISFLKLILMEKNTMVKHLKTAVTGCIVAGLGLALVAALGLALEAKSQEDPYSKWYATLGYETYEIHTPWGVERGYLTTEVAEDVKSKAKSQALGLERSAPGTLEKVCSSWSISATSDSVAEICSELKDELAEEAEAEADAQLQEWAEAEREEEEIMRRIELLHKAGGPID